MIPIPAIVAIIVVLYILSSIKILREYERGVIFRLGRLLPFAKGPGIILVFAPVDRMVRISLRQEALEVKPQDIITRDNVTLADDIFVATYTGLRVSELPALRWQDIHEEYQSQLMSATAA